VDPNRLLLGTRWGATIATGWKPIPRLGCRDGDRLEAYPTMETGWKPIPRLW
jgi:hypothetical protein